MKVSFFYRPPGILGGDIDCDCNCRYHRSDDASGGSISADNAARCKNQCILSGASALTVSQAVATPIEQEINGTPGMLYMESNSSNSGGFFGNGDF